MTQTRFPSLRFLFSDSLLGACPRIEGLLQQSWIRPYFPMILVKYTQYSPQIMEKSVSNPLSLASASILGQPPRRIFLIPEPSLPIYLFIARMFFWNQVM